MLEKLPRLRLLIKAGRHADQFEVLSFRGQVGTDAKAAQAVRDQIGRAIDYYLNGFDTGAGSA